MQPYLLVNAENGEILESVNHPRYISYGCVRDVKRWSIITTANVISARGLPVIQARVVVDIDRGDSHSHEDVVRRVMVAIQRAVDEECVAAGWSIRDQVETNGPLCMLGASDSAGTMSVNWEKPRACQYCGHYPCGCGG